MKIKRTKKFSQLDYSGNWAGLGKENFIKLEAGKTVECDPPGSLLKDKFVEEVKNKGDK